jgi:predicted O-linked N-acetylglucosamine transferase (SPINDLY family)
MDFRKLFEQAATARKRGEMARSSCALFDTARFARNIEDAYVAMSHEKTA